MKSAANLTSRGWLALAVSGAFIGAALWPGRAPGPAFLAGSFLFEDRLLLVAGWFVTGLTLLCFVNALAAARLARVAISSGDKKEIQIEAQAASGPRRTGWRIGWRLFFPLSRASLSWPGIPFVEAGLDAAGCERVAGASRGVATEILREIRFDDIFGLARGHCRLAGRPSETVVYPRQSVPAGSLMALRLFAESDRSDPSGPFEGDRAEFRQYREGEPVRHMLWQVAARTGGSRLYVRIPEKSGERRFQVRFFHGEADESSAELLDYLLRSGALGTEWKVWFSHGQGPFDARRADLARKALAASASPEFRTGPRQALPQGSVPGEGFLYVLPIDPGLIDSLIDRIDPLRSCCLVGAPAVPARNALWHRADRIRKRLAAEGIPAEVVPMKPVHRISD